jgi:hypothetical protein
MPQQITVSVKEMVQQAKAEIDEVDVAGARELIEKQGATLVDIRDIRELWRDGKVPGSRHVPRGMLEFWIDPDSPYYKDFFAGDGAVCVHVCRWFQIGAGNTGCATHGAEAGLQPYWRFWCLEQERRTGRAARAQVIPAISQPGCSRNSRVRSDLIVTGDGSGGSRLQTTYATGARPA